MKNKQIIINILDNLYEEFKAVWDLDDKDDWIKDVKKDFNKIKKLL